MDNLIFKNRKFNPQKGKSFGFEKKQKEYLYKTEILNNEFTLIVKIQNNGTVKTELTENSTGELYTLHLVKSAEGDFVGKIKDAYESELNKIAQNCFDFSIFKSEQVYEIFDYIEKKYGDTPEYLWEKFPENAVIRRHDTQKWYAAILTVKAEKLGLKSSEIVEVIDLHAKPEDIPKLITQSDIYPGYHMNKKHWYTIILDNSVETEKIQNYIDESYLLA